MLIDTGLTVSLIDEKLWTRYKQKGDHLREVQINVRSVTNQRIKIVGISEVVIRLPIKKQSILKSFKVHVFVIKDLLHKIILGIDFMKQYGGLVDAVENKLLLCTFGTVSIFFIQGYNYVCRKPLYEC